jgi:hypothetical protein
MKMVARIPCLAALLALFACAPYRVPPDVNVHRPASSPAIPLRAALHIPKQFRTHVFLGNKGGQPIRILIGDALAGGAEKSMREVFKEVVIVEDPNPDLPAGNLSVVVSPEIVEIDNRVAGFGWDSLVAIKWTIRGRDGSLLYMNKITGRGQYKAFTTAFSLREHLQKSMVPPIEDHYNKLTAHLLSVKWWEN